MTDFTVYIRTLKLVSRHSILLLLSDLFLTVEEEITAKMTKLENTWACRECPYNSRNKTHVVEHVESKHVEHMGYECPFCNKIYKNRSSYRQHKCRPGSD